jgi:hypothetical protein
LTLAVKYYEQEYFLNDKNQKLPKKFSTVTQVEAKKLEESMRIFLNVIDYRLFVSEERFN